MAPHSSTLAWKIPRTEEPGGLQSMGSWRVGDDWATFTFHFHALEKEMATHSSVLAWRIPGMGEPGGLPFMGIHRVGHYWSNLAAALIFLEGKYFLVSFRMNYPFSFLYRIPLPYSHFCTGSWSFFIFYRLPLFPRVFHPKPVVLLFSKPAV